MLSAIIIEDEIPAAERLRVLLQDCNVVLLATFQAAENALKWLETHEVDVALVDIGLPETDGLTFVEKLNRTARKIPAVIFVTAYEEHALRAFELAAADYLLKPVKIARLRAALARIAPPENSDGGKEFTHFTVNDRHRMQQIAWQQAAYLLAEEKIVWLHTFAGPFYELPHTLIYWENILGDKVVRIHRNALVMNHALECLVKMDGGSEDSARWGAKIIDSDMILPVSRRQLSALRKKLA